MPTIVNWPTAAAFVPKHVSFGASTPKSAFGAFFTGQVQSIGHLADRLRCTVTLPPCGPADGQAREAFFIGITSRGDWLRLGHLQRTDPLGTIGGTLTVASAALTGARTLQLSGAASRTGSGAATVLAGDMLSTGNQLLMVDYAGASDGGTGTITVPLVLPLAQAVAGGAAVAWLQPAGTFQLPNVQGLDVDYGRGRWQAALELNLVQAL